MRDNYKDINKIAIKCYSDPFDQKNIIYKEIKNKSGIYCWYNKTTDKIYIGSSVCLNKRLSRYLSQKHIEAELLRCKSYIYKSMLKHGYNNFDFYILKYCSINDLLKWEQYYINELKPEYNIMKVAASNLGFKHSDSTKELIRLAGLGRLHSEETKRKLHSTYRSFPVIVKNIETDEIILFPSIRRAAEYITIWQGYLAKCLNKKGFYKGRNYYVVRQTK